MPAKYILAVDLGTSGAKVALDEADAPSLPAYQPRHDGAAGWGKGGDVSEPASASSRLKDAAPAAAPAGESTVV
jgi:hypothetical protein